MKKLCLVLAFAIAFTPIVPSLERSARADDALTPTLAEQQFVADWGGSAQAMSTATTGQIPIKQADGSWKPGSNGGGATTSNFATVLANTPNPGHTGNNEIFLDTGPAVSITGSSGSGNGNVQIAFNDASGTNQPTQGMIFYTGATTGSGSGSTIDFGVAPTGASGSSLNATVRALRLNGVFQNLSGTVALATLGQVTWTDNGTNSTTVAQSININPTINYTGSTKTGHYEGWTVNVIETSLPTGTNYLERLQAGVSGGSDRHTITNTGLMYCSNNGSLPSGLSFSNSTALWAFDTAFPFRFVSAGTGAYASWTGGNSRGTTASPVAVSSGDVVAQFEGMEYIGATNMFTTVGRVRFTADGAPSDVTPAAPGRITFQTTAATGLSLVDRICIDSAGAEKHTSGLSLGWVASSSDPSGTPDTAFFRLSAGGVGLYNYGSLSSATSLSIYNTADTLGGAQTNSEDLQFSWASNVAQIGTVKTGTGTVRSLVLQTGGTTAVTINSSQLVTVGGNSGSALGTPLTVSETNTVTGAGPFSLVSFSPTFLDGGTNSSSVIKLISATPTWNFTAGTKTGHYEDYFVNNTETAIGTGVNYFHRCQVGGSDGFYVQAGDSSTTTPTMAYFGLGASQTPLFQMGRNTTADGTLGIAGSGGGIVGGSSAGDVCIRNESSSGHVMLGAGSGTACLQISQTAVTINSTLTCATLNGGGTLAMQANGTTAYSVIGAPTASSNTALTQVAGVNGALFKLSVLHNSVTTNSGTSVNFATNVPAGSAVLAATYRITTTVTGAAGNLQIQDSGGVVYATGSVLTSGTTVTGFSFAATNNYTAANTFKVVSTSGSFTAGVVECELLILTTTPPTS